MIKVRIEYTDARGVDCYCCIMASKIDEQIMDTIKHYAEEAMAQAVCVEIDESKKIVL
jgi:hypothetical protein